MVKGVYKYGNPGLAVVIGDEDSITSYVDMLKDAMPQKKFQIRFKQEIPKNKVKYMWREVTASQLKTLLTEWDLEDNWYELTGLPKKETAAGNPDDKNKNNKAAKGKKKQKNRKEKKKITIISQSIKEI